MTDEEVLRLLKIERECIKRAEHCDRNCSKCFLVQDPDKILTMYDIVIERFSKASGL
jgi:hypothetical protein